MEGKDSDTKSPLTVRIVADSRLARKTRLDGSIGKVERVDSGSMDVNILTIVAFYECHQNFVVTGHFLQHILLTAFWNHIAPGLGSS